jgi:hypothetical protein
MRTPYCSRFQSWETRIIGQSLIDELEYGSNFADMMIFSSEAAYEARKKSWRTRNNLACSGIRSRLGKFAKLVVADEKYLKDIMQALESYCKNILLELMDLFWHKRLKDYDNVGQYAKSLMDITKQLHVFARRQRYPQHKWL